METLGHKQKQGNVTQKRFLKVACLASDLASWRAWRLIMFSTSYTEPAAIESTTRIHKDGISSQYNTQIRQTRMILLSATDQD